MMIYAGSPDALAQQQNFYDSLYNQAGARNASALTDANARAIQQILAQRKVDQDQNQLNFGNQYQMNSDAQKMAFNQDQNALNRTAAADAKAASESDRNDTYQEHVLNEAAGQALQLPLNPEKLANLYPMLSPDRIKRLSVLVGAAGNRFAEQMAQQNQPVVSAATQGTDVAEAGNRIAQILRDRAAVAANPVTPPAWARGAIPFAFGPSGSEADMWRKTLPIVAGQQPNEQADVRLNEDIARAGLIRVGDTVIPDPKDKAPLVHVTPSGQFVSNYQMPLGAAPAAPVILPTNPIPASKPAAKVPDATIATLRAQAQAAIAAKKDPAAVAKRFKELTGQDF